MYTVYTMYTVYSTCIVQRFDPQGRCFTNSLYFIIITQSELVDLALQSWFCGYWGI